MKIRYFCFFLAFTIGFHLKSTAQQWSGSTTTNNDINRMGRVGIGGIPAYPLHIKGTDAEMLTIESSHASGAQIFLRSLGGESWKLLSSSTQSVLGPGYFSIFHNNTGHKFVISKGGNVGIGSTSPQNKLHLDLGATRDGIRISSQGDSNAYSDLIFQAVNSTVTNQHVYNWSISHRKDGKFSGSEANAGTTLEFFGTYEAGKWYAPLSFKSNGDVVLVSDKDATTRNVGVGTTTPEAKLDVKGADQSVLNINATSGSPDMLLTVNGNAKSQVLYDVTNQGLLFRVSMDHTGLLNWDGTNRMFINGENGHVGIGTLQTESRLTVKGTVTTEEVKVKQVQGADFVFEEDYPLPSLNTIEQYVKTHKHLPDVPSAAIMQEEGIRLGEMNILLLQKIEELTLHLIEQNKKIAELEAKIDRSKQ